MKPLLLISQQTDEWRGWLFGILGMLMFSLTLPMTRLAVAHLSPYFIASGRALLAATVGFCILRMTKQPWPTRQQWWGVWQTGLGVIVGFPFFVTVAMQHVPAVHGSVVLGILPLSTAILGALMLRERPSLGFWGCGLLGSGAVVFFSLREGGGSLQGADGLLMGAVLSASYGYVRGAQLSAQIGGWQTICWALVAWSPLLLPLTLWTEQQLTHPVPWSSWIGFLYVALFSQLFGFFAWYKGLALGGVARVSQTQLLMPFFTLFFSSALLGEEVDLETWGFAALVLIIVAVGKRMSVQTTRSRTPD